MISLRRSGRRHPLMLATATLFAVLIAMPFTAPFSSCSPTTLLAASSDAIPSRSAAPLVERDAATDHSHHDAGALTDDQFKDEAAIVEESVEETTVSSATIAPLRPATARVTRAVAAVLRL